MTRRTGLYSKKFQPSAAQQKWLSMIASNDAASALYINEQRGVSFSTMRACQLAGWTSVDGHGNTCLTHLGRAALTQSQLAA